MAVTLIFIGKLADVAGAAERDLPAPLDWHGLIAAVGTDVADAIRNERTKIAVNGEVLADKTMFRAQDGDEIALLPPVSGG